MNAEKLGGWRREIDQIDREILRLLGKRVECALGVSRTKKEHGLPVYDPEREKSILSNLCSENDTALSNSGVRKIFGEIISVCRAVQSPTTVSFLGPEDTFSHMAAIKHYGGSASFVPRGTISDVFREVEHGRADFGVVPAENSSNGAVGLTLDEWVASDLNICGEILLPVDHVLMAGQGEISGIKRVYSHPQALGQCRNWLGRNMPGAVLVETASTSMAARRALEEDDAAAVGSDMLAAKLCLSVLARNIQDQAVNLTRFFIIGRTDCSPTGRDKTSIWFVASHRPGSLYEALTPFSEAGLNLTKIESRPSGERPWTYIFFIDFEGHRSEERVSAALDALAGKVEQVKVIGSYPMAGFEEWQAARREETSPAVSRIGIAGNC